MENKRNSADDRKRERLNLYINKSASQRLSGEASIYNSSPKKDSSYSLTFLDHFKLHDNANDIFLEINDENELTNHLKNLSEIELKSNNANFSIFNFEDVATSIFKNVFDIGSFLTNFSKSTFFKDFSTCQFLVHEKGQPQAFSITANNSKITNTKVLSSLSFNNIFTKIKKSKNKQFSANDITSDHLEIIGSFLAKEFDHTDFTFIIITSRGDLFSTSRFDKDFFTKFLTSYQNLLFAIVSNTIRDFQINRAFQVIKHFPIYISVSKPSINVSSLLNKQDDVNLLNIDDFTVEYSKQDFLTTAAELYHKERIILMGELLNTLKHELSNPLFGIQIASEILKTDENVHDIDSQQLIDEIKKSAERCQNIISNFSELYSESSGKQSISLKSLIEETLTLTKSETKFLTKTIEFSNISDIHIVINSTFLSQIIFNLVINSSQALKDHKHQNPTIKIQAKIENANLQLYFLDNGPGISSCDKIRIFDPFYTSKENGTGLGLSICKKMAHKLGGDIILSNEFDNWTCFVLTLPLSEGQFDVKHSDY